MERFHFGPVALALLAVSCTSGPPPPDEAVQLQDIATHRLEKNRFLGEDRDSPIPVDKRSTLLPLPYYPPDASYIVPAQLILADERPVAEMPTSTGTVMRYQKVGVLEFSLKGQPFTLGAFSPEGKPISELFVPFVDETSGDETYAAGRYLDLRPRSTGLYTIDFNLAYNPYCAYNKSYECPYPPPSNRLKLPIRAGEKAPGQ